MTHEVIAATVRTATAADKPEWMRMRWLLWPDYDEDTMLADMEIILSSAARPVFVFERPDGHLGGFLEAGTRPFADGCWTSPVGYLEGWYVDEDLRGQGVGRALVLAAEEWTRRQGLTEMASDTDLANEAGLRARSSPGIRRIGPADPFCQDFLGRAQPSESLGR